jgi:hypothetical protein
VNFNLKIKLKLKIDLYKKSETFKPYLHKLNWISFIVAIFIVIDPVELESLRNSDRKEILTRL